jgi:hypothetical protein
MDKRWTAVLGLIALVGCSKSPSGTTANGGARRNVAGKTNTEPPLEVAHADLDSTLDQSILYSSGYRSDPISVIKSIGKAAGGTWIVVAQKPLDDVSRVNILLQQPKSARALLDGLAEAPASLQWEERPGYVLVHFGDQAGFDNLKKNGLQETPGFGMVSPDSKAALAALGDLVKRRVHGDATLLATHDRLVAELNRIQAEETAAATQAYAAYGVADPAEEPAFSYSVAEKLSADQIINKIAQKLGGADSRNATGDHDILFWTDPALRQERMDALKNQIETDPTSSIDAPGGSYSERMSGQENFAINTADLSPDAKDAVLSLAAMGDPAIPTLDALLNPERPAQCKPVLRMLLALGSGAARAVLGSFPIRVMEANTEAANKARPAVLSSLLFVLTQTDIAGTKDIMLRIARDEALPEAIRQQARTSVLRIGAVDELVPASTTRTMAPGEFEFILSESPGKAAPPPVVPTTTTPATPSTKAEAPTNTPPISSATPPPPDMATSGTSRVSVQTAPETSGIVPPPDVQKPVAKGTVVPAATITLPNGESWAVFLSPRLGNRSDLWLAHAETGRWKEFIFTGQRFTAATPGYMSGMSGEQGTKPKMSIKVDGDKISLLPADPTIAAKLDAARKGYEKMASNGGKDPKKYQEVYRRYSELSQKAGSSLAKPIELKLADLRKDTDADGLTDLVEQRLGTRLDVADTDGDGLKDGEDANPLVAPSKSPADREFILQSVFSAVAGGDLEREPILVVLPKDRWQELQGARGRVLCIDPKQYRKRSGDFNALRVLQFGGPRADDLTILKRDEPALFDPSGATAEVHYWFGAPPSSYSPTSVAVENVALLKRQDHGWKLMRAMPMRTNVPLLNSASRYRGGDF